MQEQISHSISFGNKLYPKKSNKKCICLNPICREARLYEIQKVGQAHPLHTSCEGWSYLLQWLKVLIHDKSLQDISQRQNIYLDYLENPILSILESQKLAAIELQDKIFGCFSQIKRTIEMQLDKIYINIQRKIRTHFDNNKLIYDKIKIFCNEISSGWNNNIQNAYKNYLEKDLKKIQSTGLIYVSNLPLLQNYMTNFLKQFRQIQQCFWVNQHNQQIEVRKSLKQKRKEIINYKYSYVHDANQKIQQISNLFSSKLDFIELKNATQATCFMCNTTIRVETGQNIKIRKQECRQKFCQHLYNHIDIILSNIKKNIPIKVNLEDMKRQILFKNIKNILIVDKENIKFNQTKIQNSQNLYILEIVSKNTQNIAKSKYMVAQSTGKDAADILIIIILFQLGKMNLQSLTLLTNDHYGETLQPIFANFGITIKIINHISQLKIIYDY